MTGLQRGHPDTSEQGVVDCGQLGLQVLWEPKADFAEHSIPRDPGAWRNPHLAQLDAS